MPLNDRSQDDTPSDASGIFKDHGLAKTTRQMVKVIAHLDNGRSRVCALKLNQSATPADAPIQEWDISTSSIPAHLRAIGSEFVLSFPANRRRTPGKSMG